MSYIMILFKSLTTISFKSFACLACILFLSACDNGPNADGTKTIADLNFAKAVDKQEYCDLILKSIVTSRPKVTLKEFESLDGIDRKELIESLSGYGQAINKRKGWEKDSYSFKKDGAEHIGYRWIDERHRTAVLIEITTSYSENRYAIRQLSLASRLEVLDSKSFPGGAISEKNILLHSKG